MGWIPLNCEWLSFDYTDYILYLPLNMLSRLPVDLFRAIIEDYLHSDLRLLVQLDIAFCNHKQRSDLLALLDQGVKIHHGKGFTKPQPLQEYLQWTASRAVQLSRLAIDIGVFKGGKLALAQCSNVKSIELMHIHRSTDIPIENIVHCLNHFPSLEVLSCWSVITAEQVLCLQSLEQPLRGLDLTKTSFANDSALRTVAQFVLSLSSGMHTLKLNLINDKGLARIADHCHSLQTLQLKCTMLSSSDGVVRLCAANSSTLKSLTLEDSLDDLIPLIVPCCPNLVRFRGAFLKLSDPTASILLLLAHCLRINFISINEMIVRVVENGDSRRKKVLNVSHPNQPLPVVQDLVSFISQLTVPIQTCPLVFTDESAAASSLICLGQRFGSSLEHMSLELLGKNIRIKGFDYICSLLNSCHNLVHFCIHAPPHDSLFQQLAVLASSCRQLRKLIIRSSPSEYYRYTVTVGDVRPLLCAFKAFPNNVIDGQTQRHCRTPS